MTEIAKLTQQLVEQIGQVVIGKEHQIKLAVCCLLAKGHLLIEDLPGMGKTTLSHALAQSLGLTYRRIQFTSDLLPADVIGVSIFKQQDSSFEFHPGPIFSQVVLTDEINRASPKTQSALLEAMEERQVSIDGVTRALPEPFFVIATQNPLHQSGTFPLPESQLDRFLVCIQLGFPEQDAELQMLKVKPDANWQQLSALTNEQGLLTLQQQVYQVQATDKLLIYILNLANESRQNPEFINSLSPRATKALLHASKAWAIMHGRDYVTADDVKAVFVSVAEHRLRSGHSQQQTRLSEQLLSLVEPV